MKNLLLILFCIFSTGCMTYAECAWHLQAEIVQTTWENEFGAELTASEEQCLHAFAIYYTDNIERKCRDDGLVACIVQRRESDAAARIYVSNELTPELETTAIRHELTHRITHCVLRKEYENHQHEAFAFSKYIDAEGSLAEVSRLYEDSVNLVCE